MGRRDSPETRSSRNSPASLRQAPAAAGFPGYGFPDWSQAQQGEGVFGGDKKKKKKRKKRGKRDSSSSSSSSSSSEEDPMQKMWKQWQQGMQQGQGQMWPGMQP